LDPGMSAVFSTKIMNSFANQFVFNCVKS
jgi:hypothetical protein